MRQLSFPVLLVALICCAQVASAAPKDERKFPNVGKFINNHKFGEKNGCSGGLGKTGLARCGHPPHVSELTWTYLKTTAEGDVYKMTRIYPVDTDAATEDIKEVTYKGEHLVVWEDDYQKIILRPLPEIKK